jgi:hypothetical protein
MKAMARDRVISDPVECSGRVHMLEFILRKPPRVWFPTELNDQQKTAALIQASVVRFTAETDFLISHICNVWKHYDLKKWITKF